MKTTAQLLSLILIFFLASCGGKTENNEQTSEPSAEEAYDEATEELPSASIFENLPDAGQVAAKIHLTGADYMEGLVNDPANVEYYLDDGEAKQSANVGVYFSDIGYAIMYEQAETARDQFQAAQKIAENLGTARSLDQAIFNRFSEQLEGREKAQEILDEAFDNANKNLRTEDRALLSAAATSGWYIEGLYLLTQLIENYPDDLDEETKNVVLVPLTRGVLEHGKLLDDILTIINDVKPDNTRADFFVYDLTELKASFADINLDERLANADPSTMITPDELAEITQNVAELRERIVAP
jgi:tetratricopeptide (TPR) repeat protein